MCSQVESPLLTLSTISEESQLLPPKKRSYFESATITQTQIQTQTNNNTNNNLFEDNSNSSSSSSSSSSSPTRRKNVRIRRLSILVKNTTHNNNENNSIINNNNKLQSIKTYTQSPIDDNKFHEEKTDEDTELDEASARFQWVSDPMLLHYIFSLDPTPPKRIITELSIGFGVQPRDVKQWFKERSAHKTAKDQRLRRSHIFTTSGSCPPQ